MAFWATLLVGCVFGASLATVVTDTSGYLVSVLVIGLYVLGLVALLVHLAA